MRLKFFFSTLALMMVLFAVAANAQPAQVTATTEAPVQEPLKVSGRMYLEWAKTLGNENDGGENVNTFNVKRLYLDFNKKLDNVWSTRATVDVENNVAASDSRYVAYMKYAYLQAMLDLGFGTLRTQFGLIGTPVLDLIDNQSDYRWLNQNYIDASKIVLHTQKIADAGKIGLGAKGQSIDSSADMGVSAALTVAKMVTVSAAVTQGEGYKKTNELKDGDDGKAMYGMVTVTPIEGLSIAGYIRNQVTRDQGENADDNFSQYYGGTVIYNFQGIRVGASYVLGTVSTCGTTVGEEAAVAKYTLLDVFLMANLNSLTGMPILLAGRYVVGTTKYDEGYGASNGFEADGALWAVGLGYQVNSNVRFMAYIEDQSSSSDDIPAADWKGSNRTFFIKSEARF
jgi:hypothetical protein